MPRIRMIRRPISENRIDEGGERRSLGQDQQENTIACNIKNDEDFGNYRLLTCHFDDLEIKVKINRNEQINADTISLHLPPDKCCLYENDVLVN